MRTIGNTKIEVKWIENPYFSHAFHDEKHSVIPLLFVNDVQKELRCDGATRPKYFHKNKFVIKIGDMLHDTYDLVNTYRNISKEDRKFFPKLIVYDIDKEYTVQEFVKFIVPKRFKMKHISKVNDLAEKYNLCDVNVICKNWGINPDTDEPIIFDYLVRG